MNYCYLLYIPGTNRTYIGATNDPAHRLRQHNGELAGGAKATHGQQWTQAFYVSGFPDWRTTLQFEWSWKRQSRGHPGLPGKIVGLKKLLALNKPTSAAIPYSLWLSPVRFHITLAQRLPLQKIEAAKFMLETQHSTMSSITSANIATFSAQLDDVVTELALLKQRVDTALVKSDSVPKAAKAKKEPKAVKPTKEKKVVDPDAPKKPLQGYMLFCDTKRKAAPTEKLTVKDLASQWKTLSAEEKAKFSVVV